MLNFSSLKGDIFGGITAAVIALPLAFAFGIMDKDTLNKVTICKKMSECELNSASK